MDPGKAAGAALLFVVASSTACGRSKHADATPALGAWGTEDGGLPATLEGPLAVPARTFELGVYLPLAPQPETVAWAQAGAREKLAGVTVLPRPNGAAPRPTALVFAPGVRTLAPPTVDLIRFDGRGIRPDQAEGIAASKGVIAIVVSLDDDPGFKRLHAAQELAFESARLNAGFIWDDATREIYSPDEWQRSRLGGWDGDLPEVRRQLALHYDDSPRGGHRLVTLGMEKLGLPDLALGGVLHGEIGSATRVVDIVAQLLAEGAKLDPGGVLHFDVGAIANAGARQALLDSATGMGQLRGPLTLVPVLPQPGDPDNRLVEIRFPLYDAMRADERAHGVAERPLVVDGGRAPDGGGAR